MAESAVSARDPDGLARFLEAFALALNEAGMPRMPARVVSALMVSEHGRLTAAELAERLQVSPAAVSGAVRYLVQVQLLERRRDPGDRRDHYRMLGDPWFESIVRRDKELAGWQDLLAAGAAAAGPDNPVGARLDQARRFFGFLHAELPGLVQRWRAEEYGER